jgi:glyoxylase-like metal-dependent hydrolase (beta-lactamase superfamily II)
MKKLFCSIVFFLASTVWISAQKPAPDFEVQKLAEGVYAAIATPDGKAVSNSGFIVNDSDVIVIDCHITPEIARALLAEIKKVTSRPVHNLALTHRHRDHVGGTTSFGPEVEIIAHENTRLRLAADSSLAGQIKLPGLTFDSRLSFYRPSRTIELFYLGRGHTDGDIAVWLPAEKILFTGDLYFNGSAGYLGDGFFADWISNLKKLEALPAENVVPGHGPVSARDGLLKFGTYLADFRKAVNVFVDSGKTLEETLQNLSLPQYQNLSGWDRFKTRNITRCYQELKGGQR